MKRAFIFDLDETVIDSKHRTPNNPDGTLNLAAYLEKNTPENIAKDALLPLAAVMRGLIATGEHVIIITARDMGEHDIAFLKANGLYTKWAYHRGRCKSLKHYRMADGEYKQKWLDKVRNMKTFKGAHFIMIDDAKPVKTAMRKSGIVCLCAHKVNRKLKGE